jgi:hypothetical protein
MWLNWKVMLKRYESLEPSFLTCTWRRFKQNGLLSAYCATGLLRNVWHRNSLLELRYLWSACLNSAIVDPIRPKFATWDLCIRHLTHMTCLPDLCSLGVVLARRCNIDPFLTKFCDQAPVCKSRKQSACLSEFCDQGCEFFFIQELGETGTVF